MTHRRVIAITALAALLGLIVWAVAANMRHFVPTGSTATQELAGISASSGVAHITATLYYASADGEALVPVRREVPFAEGVVAQGRAILAAQLEAAPPPHVSVIPTGTNVRAFYVTARGDAFVDLSSEISSRHPGGTSAELLTVYAVVNALTANLPTVQRVQILVDGREADTLAGHVDLRRPLRSDASLVRNANTGD